MPSDATHQHDEDHRRHAPPVLLAEPQSDKNLVLRRPGGLSGVPRTRSHLELGRQTHQRPWYCVSRHGRVGRRQACPAQDHLTPDPIPSPRSRAPGAVRSPAVRARRYPLTPRTAPPDTTITAGWSSPVARQAHNLKVVGSNPTPATKIQEQYQPDSPPRAGLSAF